MLIKNFDEIEFVQCKKKPIIVECCQINFEFEVESLEGKVKGKKGDYLMKGINGEFYICDREIFKKTYDLI